MKKNIKIRNRTVQVTIKKIPIKQGKYDIRAYAKILKDKNKSG